MTGDEMTRAPHTGPRGTSAYVWGAIGYAVLVLWIVEIVRACRK